MLMVPKNGETKWRQYQKAIEAEDGETKGQ